MMRGIHPTNSAELPMTRNMPFSTKTMPSKYQPRNMTGIYLGLEGNVKPPASRIVPPLARGRGISQRIRTPTEQRRYKMVEQLRIKEEKKGFVGQTVKSAKRTKSSHHDERRRAVATPETVISPITSPRSVGARRWGPGKSADRSQFFDLIKKNPRNYTVVVNNGVTRSENLSGLMSFVDDNDGMTIPFAEALAEEVHRVTTKDQDEIIGLEECFKKVCKGNVESLHSLLPYRKQQQNQLHREQTNYTTGFTVRSYRNPNQAEIMANFSDGNSPLRPRTVPADSINNRPIVPSPYFFRHYNNAYGKMKIKASSAKSQKSAPSQLNFESQLSSLNNGKVFAAPGAGGLTKSLKGRTATAAWGENDDKLRGKLQGTPREITTISRDNGIEAVIKEGGKQVQISMKVSTGLDTPVDSSLNTQPIKDEQKSNKDINTPAETPKMMETVPKPVDSSADVTQGDEKKDGFEIEVADEHGKMGEVVIDAPEEESEDSTPIKGNVRKASISEKVEKSRLSQAYVETIKEDAEIRRKEFEKMLNEHAEIVQEIGRANSTENLEENRDH